MSLPRVRLFEFNDSAWAPLAVRDTIIESLSRTLDWGRMLRGLVGPFESFLAEAGTTDVLDVCAGAAGPARILAREIHRGGRKPPRFLLTDIFPQLEAWERLRAELPGTIDYVAEPVDATAIAADLSAGRARVIINAFHHFGPELASSILADAVRNAAPIFIAESFDRNPLAFAGFAPAGIPALLLNPLLSPRQRLAKAALTYLTPVMFAISAWDGVVSTLRVYDESELRAMVAPHGDAMRWTFGRYAVPFGGSGYYFHGVPRVT